VKRIQFCRVLDSTGGDIVWQRRWSNYAQISYSAVHTNMLSTLITLHFVKTP